MFVRGLGERYSNTTLAGSVLPTTEPDKKVVPLDLFPTGLIDSVQVSKSYSPDRSAEFAGGLVQIVPMKLPTQPVFDLSYGVSYYTTSTGKDIPLSPLGSRDVWGFDSGARALPSGFPNDKIVRQGIYTPEVGYTADEITDFGRMFENLWRPTNKSGKPGQNWSTSYGNRFGNLGVVASMTHSYKEQFVEEDRRFFRIGDARQLEAASDYHMQIGTQRAQLGMVGNLSYQFSPSQRLSVDNFYTHSGRDEGRFFQGINLDNAREYQEQPRCSSSRRGCLPTPPAANTSSRACRTPGSTGAPTSRARHGMNLTCGRRSTNACSHRPTAPFLYADESQSGFRMFNDARRQHDRRASSTGASSTPPGTGRLSTSLAWPTSIAAGTSSRAASTSFRSRRRRPTPATSCSIRPLPPEEIFIPSNIGTAFRLNEETRPTDGYRGDLTTAAGYGMFDMAFSARGRA